MAGLTWDEDAATSFSWRSDSSLIISSVTIRLEGAVVSSLVAAPFAFGEAEWTDVAGVVVVLVGVVSREPRVDFVDFDTDVGL